MLERLDNIREKGSLVYEEQTPNVISLRGYMDLISLVEDDEQHEELLRITIKNFIQHVLSVTNEVYMAYIWWLMR